jgi:hypothetical protein
MSGASADSTLTAGSNPLGRSIGRSLNLSPSRMRERFVDRVLVEANVEHRFTEHDLRAQVAGDAASLTHLPDCALVLDSATGRSLALRFGRELLANARQRRRFIELLHYEAGSAI